MTENIRVCVLNARKSKKRFCSYLNDNFDCTAPTYEYDYCIGFLKKLGGDDETNKYLNEFNEYRNNINRILQTYYDMNKEINTDCRLVVLDMIKCIAMEMGVELKDD